MINWTPTILAILIMAVLIRRLFDLGGKEADIPRVQLGLASIALTTSIILSHGNLALGISEVAALILLLWIVVRLTAVNERLGSLKDRLIAISTQLETTSETASSAIESSERRFKELADIAPVGIFEIDASGSLIFMSPRWLQVTGLTNAKVGQVSFMTAVHPEDRTVIELALLLAMSNQSRFEEVVRFLHGDGQVVWAAVVAVPITRDGSDAGTGFVGTALDVTELRAREIERRRLRERVERAERMESLGKLAGGIAHDLNNLLVPILGNAEGLLRTFGKLSSERPRAEQIRQAALRASELVNRMLSYAGAGHGEHEHIDLIAIYSDLRRYFETKATGRVTLKIELDDEKLPVQGDPIRIAKVFQSAFNYSLESMDGTDGELGIRLGLTALGPREIDALIIGESMLPGAFAVYELRDQGVELDYEKASLIFDPLTKGSFDESNLELLQVASLARTMKGGLGLRRNGKKGKVLSLYLPIAGAEAEPSMDARALQVETTEVPASGVTILLIDDDEAVRMTIRMALQDKGYEVVEASHGLEGVNIIAEKRADLSAVLLDLTMPTMDGEEVFAWLSTHAPELPVLFLSGYGERDLVLRLTNNSRLTAFLRKPFVSKELYLTLDHLLQRANSIDT